MGQVAPAAGKRRGGKIEIVVYSPIRAHRRGVDDKLLALVREAPFPVPLKPTWNGVSRTVVCIHTDQALIRAYAED